MKIKITTCLLLTLIIISKITILNAQTVTDIDGNVYNTVIIGDQIWMAENLRVTHAPDGRDIFYFDYNDDSTDVATYGRLYEWVRLMHTSQTEGSQGICPDGWHVPSDAEWEELASSLGGANVAGGKMKVSGTDYWLAPNTGATNSSGFNAKAAGEWDGVKYWLREKYSIYWSSTSTGTNTALYRYLSYQDTELTSYDYFKNLAYSVRCVKNQVSGISDINENYLKSIAYPNPFSNYTTINIPQEMSGYCKIHVFDLSGKSVEIDAKINHSSIIIKRGNMKKGIYFYSISSLKGNIIRGKIIAL